ncbi:DUF1360 domain-containing protein [Legionella rubrilucens]|uniref:DUF1360 domain-containing protein n=1 Tax=Legionella rubrilucens TaxID=458 RepID=UPI00138F899D
MSSSSSIADSSCRIAKSSARLLCPFCFSIWVTIALAAGPCSLPENDVILAESTISLSSGVNPHFPSSSNP